MYALWTLLVVAAVLLSDGIPMARSTSDVDEERISEASIGEIEKDLEDELTVESRQGTIYLNEWAAEIPGGKEVADIIARDLGYRNMGQIGRLDNYFLFEKLDHPVRSKRSADHHTRALTSDSRVLWAEQQRSIKRVKRDVIDKRQEARAYRNVRYTDEKWDKQWYLTRKREAGDDRLEEAYKNADSLFSDDQWEDEWYLLPDGFDKRNDLPGKMDLHVVPVWDAGITGKGVVVTVLDDGLEKDHPDLAKNYSPEASYDYNDDDDDPTPRYDKKKTNKHGTRCAGEIAMVANNGICGVGVAYDAKIGGIRMLDGIVTDKLEALALNHGLDVVDVYSASWGPNDNGETVEGPAKLATRAFLKGITSGRGGKGVIYVWASGNGGNYDDNCDCDGYTGSIYTISISSASHSLTSPWYAELCASTMATTYSSGAYGEEKIVTTDISGRCTNDHTGTSAAAPLAAGIVALLLQKHPELTWRDVQHLIVWTSEYAPLSAVDGWHENGAGFFVNSKFGFGLLNAYSLVNAADKSAFKTVPENSTCTVATDVQDNKEFPVHLESGHVVKVTLETSGCHGQDNEVNYLEHVQVYIDMSYTRRGVLEIWLVSPSGTNTTLLTRRWRDHSTKGFTEWPFMSVHTWGEDPKGKWIVGVADQESKGNSGDIRSVTLVLHGTKKQPWHVKHAGGKRVYDIVRSEDTATNTTSTPPSGDDDDENDQDTN